MTTAAASSTTTLGPIDDHDDRPRPAPLTPGKFALWLFLATEVMFFTGLIGSYIVLRAGSAPGSYSTMFAPGTNLDEHHGTTGLVVLAPGANRDAVAAIVARERGIEVDRARSELAHGPTVAASGLTTPIASRVEAALRSAGATVRVEALDAGSTFAWPRPYDRLTNPLSIDLTAVNTFILICSSATMALALASIQRGRKWRLRLFLLLTLALGGTFLGIQVYEYRELLFVRHFPPGISSTGHFTPDVSLFASCFFTLTGFHGLHVAAGLLALSLVFLRSLAPGRFGYSADSHSPVELTGLYWHFVDLVWIIVFTVVYLI
jgi:heme/copper-type cytochrome/quinol oxidase subunit 3